jgi:predicted ATPase
MIRPYGLWIDLLGSFPNETDRTRLFEAVVELLSGVTLIAIDDLQWIDESSTALLHYVARTSTSRIVLAARNGELDNPLFTIELARAQHPGSLLEVIGERITHLEGAARDVVSWAAAVGRQFDAEIVGRATGMPAGEMLAALERLGRDSLLA